MAVSNRRLWFHLDEVLPLAEHAMACRHHPPTGAQAAALGPNGPALVITHTSDGDLLTSNGHPRWYDATGNVHAAQARSWRQPGTGRRGSPFHADRPTAYLPLHHTADGTRLAPASDTAADRITYLDHANRHLTALDGQQRLLAVAL